MRQIGIGCPEPGQPGRWEAMEADRQLVEGQTVRPERDVSEIDQYGRLLRYVFVGDLLVNAELVRRGYTVAVTFPPDLAYADFFPQLESGARREVRGLWAPTSGVTPGSPYYSAEYSSGGDVLSYS